MNNKEEEERRVEPLFDLVSEDGEPEYDEQDEDEFEYDPAPRRRWIRNTVVTLLVAAFIGNILAFWPQIYNRETLPFLFKSKKLSAIEEIQDYKQAVVVVGTGQSKGTGFHVSDGYIVTNYHVIDGGASSVVQFPDRQGSFEAKPVGVDPELDIAILKVDTEGRDLPYIDIDRDGTWESGSHVYVIGNPLFFTQIVNEGQVLGLVPIRGRASPALALDAPVFKGNSGSPVIDENGKAIAVVFATGEVEHENKPVQAGLAVPLGDFKDMLSKYVPED